MMAARLSLLMMVKVRSAAASTNNMAIMRATISKVVLDACSQSIASSVAPCTSPPLTPVSE